MPYIKQERRDAVEMDWGFATPGELNYFITRAVLTYLDDIRPVGKNNKYKDYNEVIGVLECVKQELYRRLIVPYENKKKEENGDVY